MAEDRTQSNVLNITQEFLAEMLGARRTTVTMVAGALQRSGLIEYRRGHVRILNRENLEEAAVASGACFVTLPLAGYPFVVPG
jgi:Mn-dependent DtxR family transcriptional regulator